MRTALLLQKRRFRFCGRGAERSGRVLLPELFQIAYFFAPVPDAVEHIAQDQNITAEIEPDQQDDDRGQGPVHQGIPGGHADEPGEQGRGGHQGGGGEHRAGQKGGTGLAPGGGHAVDYHHEQEHQAEQDEKAQPLPVPGQGAAVQVEQLLRQLKQPLAGEQDGQGEVDRDEKEDGNATLATICHTPR